MHMQNTLHGCPFHHNIHVHLPCPVFLALRVNLSSAIKGPFFSVLRTNPWRHSLIIGFAMHRPLRLCVRCVFMIMVMGGHTRTQ